MCVCFEWNGNSIKKCVTFVSSFISKVTLNLQQTETDFVNLKFFDSPFLFDKQIIESSIVTFNLFCRKCKNNWKVHANNDRNKAKGTESIFNTQILQPNCSADELVKYELFCTISVLPRQNIFER